MPCDCMASMARAGRDLRGSLGPEGIRKDLRQSERSQLIYLYVPDIKMTDTDYKIVGQGVRKKGRERIMLEKARLEN